MIKLHCSKEKIVEQIIERLASKNDLIKTNGQISTDLIDDVKMKDEIQL